MGNQIPHAISSCQRNAAHVHRVNGSLNFHRARVLPDRRLVGPNGGVLPMNADRRYLPCPCLDHPICGAGMGNATCPAQRRLQLELSSSELSFFPSNASWLSPGRSTRSCCTEPVNLLINAYQEPPQKWTGKGPVSSRHNPLRKTAKTTTTHQTIKTKTRAAQNSPSMKSSRAPKDRD